MGLQLTLDKKQNNLGYTFENAYWSICGIYYTTNYCNFCLNAYPNRETKLLHGEIMPQSTLPVGASILPTYNTILYSWSASILTKDIFGLGIPLNEAEQKTAIYKYVKQYTKLPFIDVFEEYNMAEDK